MLHWRICSTRQGGDGSFGRDPLRTWISNASFTNSPNPTIMSNQDEPTSVLSYFPAGYTDSERRKKHFYGVRKADAKTSDDHLITLPKKFVDTIGGSDPVDDCHVL
ncbi:hypothetical protein AeRB84_006988, partial [Aphanomyces euteiches]